MLRTWVATPIPPPVQLEAIADLQPQIQPPSQSTVAVTNLPLPPPINTANVSLSSAAGTPLELALAKRLEEMEAMIQRIPGVPTPIRKSQSYSYTDSPFVDALALVEMPRKFTFPNMKPYDGTADPTDHIASYK